MMGQNCSNLELFRFRRNLNNIKARYSNPRINMEHSIILKPDMSGFQIIHFLTNSSKVKAKSFRFWKNHLESGPFSPDFGCWADHVIDEWLLNPTKNVLISRAVCSKSKCSITIWFPNS